MRMGSGLGQGVSSAPTNSSSSQIVQVLESAAQRVAEVTQEQVIASARHSVDAPDLQALAKQQHVLKITAQAVDQVSHAQYSHPTPLVAVADAAEQMVMQAASVAVVQKQAVVDDQVSAGLMPPNSISTPVTVNEVSIAAEQAVAKAVELTGPLSSEVHVLMTARSLLQQQEHVLGSTPPTDSLRPLPPSAGSTPPSSVMAPPALPPISYQPHSVLGPPPLPPLPPVAEFV